MESSSGGGDRNIGLKRDLSSDSIEGDAAWQGLTLVHFSAQLEPCLTHKNTLHTLNTP